MRLHEVLPGDLRIGGDNPPVAGLAYDSRLVKPGTLFFCVSGYTRDGHDFAPDAVLRGAAGLVVEQQLDLPVNQVVVESVRAAMAPVAAEFYADPTASLDVAGITGTNGKTTTAFLVRELLEAGGRQTGLLGTVKSVVAGVEHEVKRTTPEAIDLQRTFREMVDGGDRACVMEVSSHALALHRADAIHFDVVIFTNLTQDHLDFHPTMEDYFQAKRLLFVAGDGRPGGVQAVINVDDPYGARLAAELGDDVTTFASHAEATYRAHDVHTGFDGTRFTVETPDGPLQIRSPLRGEFNVSNALAALAAGRALGVPAETCVAALANAGQVPGRFETVDAGQPFAVLVDYAHTPDSLENVRRAARGMTEHRLRVVFGCGGDRDRGKRPQMGEIARRLADDVIITSDNPRSEDPEAIIDEILAGSGNDVAHYQDREAAIAHALREAQPRDVVVIAGKGHEQGQEFADGHKIPFDDVAVTRALLAEIVG
jgi:UDP-N-acetylmuramoyl-L-alanyl-D-glutamate--2,6-diaminopimelate ligase